MYVPPGKGFIWPKGLSDEKAGRMLEALRNGETLQKFHVKAARLDAYLGSHPEYAREALPLIKANAVAAVARKGNHNRNKTHCTRGHSLADAYVSRRHGWVHRRCIHCKKEDEETPLSSDIREKIRTALTTGGLAVSQICSKKATNKHFIINSSRLYAVRRNDPELDRLIIESYRDPNSTSRKKRRLLHRTRVDTARRREDANDYHRVLAMIPVYLPGREDIAQNMFVALLEGSLRRDQVQQRIQTFIRLHNAEDRKQGVGKFGMRSLDAPLFADGTATLGDRISRGLWD